MYLAFIISKKITPAEIDSSLTSAVYTSFLTPYHNSTKRQVHFDNKYFFVNYPPGTKIYYLEFTQNKLSAKGFFTVVALTEEENKEFLKEQRKLQ